MPDEWTEIATYYDELYVKPERYSLEATKALSLVETYKLSKGNELLDLACGTGGHIPYWREKYRVTGLDNSPEMLSRAKSKFPDISFIRHDMMNFTLDRQFDAMMCLYGSIGFREIERIKRV